MDNRKNFLSWLRKDSGCSENVPCDLDDPMVAECCVECSPCCCEGDKDKKIAKGLPKSYENLTDEDVAYIEAVRRGDETTYGPMIKRAFFRKFPNSVVRDEVWRRDKSSDFTEFKLKRKEKTDAGWLGEGVYFFGAYEEARNAFDYGWNLRQFFINVERYYPLDKSDHDAIARANARGVSHEVTRITKDFDGVFYNGDMREEWCVRDPSCVKAAWPTYDDEGRIIPLSYRFDKDIADFRY